MYNDNLSMITNQFQVIPLFFLESMGKKQKSRPKSEIRGPGYQSDGSDQSGVYEHYKSVRYEDYNEQDARALDARVQDSVNKKGITVREFFTTKTYSLKSIPNYFNL